VDRRRKARRRSPAGRRILEAGLQTVRSLREKSWAAADTQTGRKVRALVEETSSAQTHQTAIDLIDLIDLLTEPINLKVSEAPHPQFQDYSQSSRLSE